MFKVRDIVIFLAETLAIMFFMAFVVAVFLAIFAWFSRGPSRKTTYVDPAKTRIGLLEETVRTYHETLGSYPPNLDALRVAPANVPQDKWAGPYLTRDMPLDPWSHPFQYSSQSKHGGKFDVWTVSPEGQEIGNWYVDECAAGSGQLSSNRNKDAAEL